MVVLGRDHDPDIARLDCRTQIAHRFGCVLAIIILVVERHPVQRENAERGLGRKPVLKTAKHCGAIGGAAQAAGEAEKAELGHIGAAPKRMWICIFTCNTIRYDMQVGLVRADGSAALPFGPKDKHAQLHWTFGWSSCPVFNNSAFCVRWPSNAISAVLREVVRSRNRR